MSTEPPRTSHYGNAEIGALAHLYRGEMYRSKIWRTRLDATTNWAVVTVGIALSVSYSSASASALPLVLVGALLCVFLTFEARRYRFFDIFRVRVRVMETSFFGPLLRHGRVDVANGWNDVLADDYTGLYYHITYAEALGRRLRRNYGPIFIVQLVAYLGKIIIHPGPLTSLGELFERAAIGPFPGGVVLTVCFFFYSGLAVFAAWTLRFQQAIGRAHRPSGHDNRIMELTNTELY